MVEIDDSIFGTDYNSTGELTSNGDISLVSGLDNAKQNIRNWLLTDKGFYPSIDSEYGSQIREALGDDFDDATIDVITVYIQNALYANPRVQSIESIAPYITVNNELLIQLGVTLVNGESESFNINLEELT